MMCLCTPLGRLMRRGHQYLVQNFDSFFATAVTSLFEMGWWKKCGRDGCTSDENVIEEKREE